MNTTENSTTCVTICWGLGALAGLLILILTSGALGFVLALLLGLVIAAAAIAVLQKVICGADFDSWGPFERLKGADAPEPRPTDAPRTPVASAPQPEVAATPAPVAPASTQLPGETELSARKGTWRYEAAPNAPAGLTVARDGGADNLKLIKGIGPKLEALLHEKGYYHFDQIAAWTDSDVAWMDENLEGFKGRVSRDDWVAQARTLAEGGETEFSRRNA